MGKKRERYEVIHDILLAVREKEGIKPTRLLYKSNLSPQMYKEYIAELLKNGMMIDESGYKITEKGLIFLEKYARFTAFVEEMGL